MKKQGYKLEDFKCDHCGKTTKKPKKQLDRNKREKRKSYCSRSCSAIANNKGRTRRKSDNYTPYRYTLRNCTKRQHSSDIDLDFLHELWLKQKGKCAYTGIKLILPTYSKTGADDPVHRASLDRIDSNQGYLKNNVQFISTSINYLKNTMSHQQTLNFLNELSTISSSQRESGAVGSP